MARRASRMIGSAVAGAASVVLLAGCAAPENPADAAARDAVAWLVGEISPRQASDIDGWARLATEATGDRSTITLIGITPQTAQEPIDPLGTLSFRVEMTARSTDMWSADTVSSTSCYAVDFTRYGAVAHERPWGAPSPVRTIDCPDGAAAVTAPPDTSPVFVVPEEAADAILAVVGDASATASTSELESAILARLTPPTGPYEHLAPLEVVRTADGALGASMGAESRCVLVRRVDGVTERVYAPRVYLQPGELGCRGTTALSDLRPPH